MTQKLIKTEQFKELFNKIIEVGEYYCEMFGIENENITRAKHNLLALENAVLFKEIYDQVFKQEFVTSIAKVVNTFGDNKILEIDNEINKNRPTEK